MLLKQKARSLLSNKFLTFQLSSFALGKVCFWTVELPHDYKQSSIVIYLLISSLLYTLSISLKIARHKSSLMQQLPKMLIESYLPLFVGLISMMFTFVLQDKLDYSFLQQMLTMLVVILELVNLVLVCRPQLTSKIENLFYSIILAVNVIVLAEKSLWFLAYEDDVINIKSIVLLNLVTQMILSFIFMQYINTVYRKHKQNLLIQMKEDSVRIEKELEMTT